MKIARDAIFDAKKTAWSTLPTFPARKSRKDADRLVGRLAGEGGRLPNPDAPKAVHEFLRFQIEDHHTGDTTEIPTDR